MSVVPLILGQLPAHVYRVLEKLAPIESVVGARRPLGGTTFAVKDNFAVAGVCTTAGLMHPLHPEPESRSAEAIVTLENSGARAVSLVAMDELAHGFTNLNTRRSACRNPHDQDRIAGGSSGGSAIAVALGEADFALATDTNGSARVPAALCGAYGVKPTYGWTSMCGVVPFAPSLDHVGVIAASLETCRKVTLTLAGGFAEEAAGSRWAAINASQAARFATTEVSEVFEYVIDRLPVCRVVLPDLDLALQHALVITAAEFAEHHAGLLERTGSGALSDAVHFGLTVALDLESSRLGVAERGCEEMREAMAAIWREVDVLILPTAPCVAPLVEEETFTGATGQSWEREPYLGVFTSLFSLVGAPAISIPILRSGLPIGVQVVTAPGREELLFRAAEWIDRALNRPEVAA